MFKIRFEIIPAVTLLIGVVKLSICLMAVNRGVAHIIGARDYRFIVIPVALYGQRMIPSNIWIDLRA